MHANEMHELAWHHKVSPTLNSNQNKSNSVEHEGILTWQKSLSYIKYPNSGLGAFLDIVKIGFRGNSKFNEHWQPQKVKFSKSHFKL